MPATHEIADLVHEFNRIENTIQFDASGWRYARVCSYFAMAGIPFVTIPQDAARFIIVLADEKAWRPVFDLACNTDDESTVRMVMDELRGKAMASTAPMMAAMYPTSCDEVTYSDSDVLRVLLIGVPDSTKKIEVIKAVRMITHKGLKEAKDMVDLSMGFGHPRSEPQLVAEVLKKEAEELGRDLVLAGAAVRLDLAVPF